MVNSEIPNDDPELTEQQTALIESLSEAELSIIDEALLSCAKQRWSKVAMIVGTVMFNNPNQHQKIPDIFYAHRIRKLVEKGELISQGNLKNMRYSEVKLP